MPESDSYTPATRLEAMLAGQHLRFTAEQASAALEHARAELKGDDAAGMIGGEPWGRPELGLGLIGVIGESTSQPVYWIAVTDGKRAMAIRARDNDNELRGDTNAVLGRVREISETPGADRFAALAEMDETLSIS